MAGTKGITCQVTEREKLLPGITYNSNLKAAIYNIWSFLQMDMPFHLSRSYQNLFSLVLEF